MRLLFAYCVAGAAGCWVTTDGLSNGAPTEGTPADRTAPNETPSGTSTSSSSSSSGSSNAGSSSGHDDGGSSADGGEGGASGDGSAPRRVAFVTSTRMAGGDLGGLAGADATCGTYGRLLVGHSRFKAWLSDSTQNAIDRIEDAGPWYAADRSTLLFANKSALATVPANGILLDEAGSPNTTAGNWGYFWTGTVLGGTKSTNNCGDWMNASSTARGTVGEETVTTPAWTSTGTSPCDLGWPRRLFCLEQ